jgi:hypothetical protein
MPPEISIPAPDSATASPSIASGVTYAAMIVDASSAADRLHIAGPVRSERFASSASDA